MKIPLFPEQASTFAPDVDHLYFYLVAVSVFFTILIFASIFFLAIKYRKRAGNDGVPKAVHTGIALEIVWSVIPFGLSMVMFGWGAEIFFRESRPPKDALSIYVVAKQWMWKLEHMEGQREINELHIPVGRPIRLTMTSEDVIHSFYVPAFRTKQDVVPGRYSTTWFTPTQTGKYHLFCAEYCGTTHSGMIGWVYVLSPEDYQDWLSGGKKTGTLAERGEKLFNDLACSNCHKPDNSGRCPTLVSVFGSTVKLVGGATAKADEAYIRESILRPDAKVVFGYQPLMPTFQGQVTEEDVLELVEYVKSLTPKPPALAPAAENKAQASNR